MDIFNGLSKKRKVEAVVREEKVTQESQDVVAASKKIEELGLKRASHYHRLSEEANVRQKLSYIDKHIEEEAKTNGNKKILLPDVLFDEFVRAALDLQGFEIDPSKVEADCVCGNEKCEGIKSGCLPAGYWVSWEKVASATTQK